MNLLTNFVWFITKR